MTTRCSEVGDCGDGYGPQAAEQQSDGPSAESFGRCGCRLDSLANRHDREHMQTEGDAARQQIAVQRSDTDRGSSGRPGPSAGCWLLVGLASPRRAAQWPSQQLTSGLLSVSAHAHALHSAQRRIASIHSPHCRRPQPPTRSLARLTRQPQPHPSAAMSAAPPSQPPTAQERQMHPELTKRRLLAEREIREVSGAGLSLLSTGTGARRRRMSHIPRAV